MFKRFLAAALISICLAPLAIGQSERLADPMRPALRTPGGAGARNADALRLQGIVIAKSRKLALIAGEFLEEGQQIFGARIERIERDTVTVVRNGKTLVLRPESAAPVAAETGESP